MVQASPDGALASSPSAAPGVLASSPSAALDLLEGNSAREGLGCPRWPAELGLLSTLGAYVRGRCHAVNLCDYCARMAARETAELLQLDAVEGGEAPQV